MFLTEHGVSDGNQRRFSAVNAETVYARYNACYAVIIPYLYSEVINNLLQLIRGGLIREKPGYSLVIVLCVVIHDNCIFSEFFSFRTFEYGPQTPQKPSQRRVSISCNSLFRIGNSFQIDFQQPIQLFCIVI